MREYSVYDLEAEIYEAFMLRIMEDKAPDTEPLIERPRRSRKRKTSRRKRRQLATIHAHLRKKVEATDAFTAYGKKVKGGDGVTICSSAPDKEGTTRIYRRYENFRKRYAQALRKAK